MKASCAAVAQILLGPICAGVVAWWLQRRRRQRRRSRALRRLAP